MQDYIGDMRYFQNQLTAKGITKEQIDMNNYAGLTFSELQSIVDNYTLFIKKVSDDKFNMLKNINISIPDGFTEESYAISVNWSDIFERTFIDTNDKLLLFRFIKNNDIIKVEESIKHNINEFYEKTTGYRDIGTHSFWFDKKYEDKEFRPFALICEEVSPRDIWSDKTYLQMLLDAYNNF